MGEGTGYVDAAASEHRVPVCPGAVVGARGTRFRWGNIQGPESESRASGAGPLPDAGAEFRFKGRKFRHDDTFS